MVIDGYDWTEFPGELTFLDILDKLDYLELNGWYISNNMVRVEVIFADETNNIIITDENDFDELWDFMNPIDITGALEVRIYYI